MADFPSFDEFYQAVHGYAPFPWQSSLAEQAIDHGWPDAIAVPTGAGKTSVLDVAVYALAAEHAKPALERHSRLRTLFVVDRRLVVDEAADHARRLAEALQASLAGPTLSAIGGVARSLLTFGGRFPLHVSVLRGALFRDDAWVDQPNQPSI